MLKSWHLKFINNMFLKLTTSITSVGLSVTIYEKWCGLKIITDSIARTNIKYLINYVGLFNIVKKQRLVLFLFPLFSLGKIAQLLCSWTSTLMMGIYYQFNVTT